MDIDVLAFTNSSNALYRRFCHFTYTQQSLQIGCGWQLHLDFTSRTLSAMGPLMHVEEVICRYPFVHQFGHVAL